MRMNFPFSIPPVSLEKKKLLEKHLFKENLQRCKLFAKIVILFEVILIMMNVSSSVVDNGHFEINTYLVLYFILLIMSITMLLYMRWFEKRPECTKRQYERFRFGLLGFVNFFLVWGAVVTLVDQKDYGHVMAFAVNFMCVSILFHASNRTILFLYILPIAVIFIGLPIFQPSNVIVMGHYINLTVFLFFCWLASRMLYISVSTTFYHKLLLTETNNNLAAKIAENEKMNKELAKVNHQLRQLTIIDELTKIPNRRGFQQFIRERLGHSNTKQNLSLMMLDIDAFKLFNDNYGHLEGDKVITIVAQTIQTCIDATTSFTARFGGEEFVIAAFDLEFPEMYQVAEAIREAVWKRQVPHEYSPVANQISVSIGIASGYVHNEAEVGQLLENADHALYKSKSRGRNRVEYFEEQFNSIS
ncbi:GGDEF domain-containing protein [Neobacillus sp. MM2021_6]|uniref:GGDEF domain-containing protein n=1 Tax=Bacillaceae TaxID=186817 RepID=UPI001409E44D|nr:MULTISPECIES: GGDEF domain-containing protein [Bacillaceae]MBO0959619.1 GGDEF domain-containing protein [Neobacillus sp. MM2021_6]NHC20145.1 GGDEF domain-containing protein [Bacillus sp. MM2020_4]